MFTTATIALISALLASAQFYQDEYSFNGLNCQGNIEHFVRSRNDSCSPRFIENCYDAPWDPTQDSVVYGCGDLKTTDPIQVQLPVSLEFFDWAFVEGYSSDGCGGIVEQFDAFITDGSCISYKGKYVTASCSIGGEVTLTAFNDKDCTKMSDVLLAGTDASCINDSTSYLGFQNKVLKCHHGLYANQTSSSVNGTSGTDGFITETYTFNGPNCTANATHFSRFQSDSCSIENEQQCTPTTFGKKTSASEYYQCLASTSSDGAIPTTLPVSLQFFDWALIEYHQSPQCDDVVRGLDAFVADGSCINFNGSFWKASCGSVPTLSAYSDSNCTLSTNDTFSGSSCISHTNGLGYGTLKCLIGEYAPPIQSNAQSLGTSFICALLAIFLIM